MRYCRNAARRGRAVARVNGREHAFAGASRPARCTHALKRLRLQIHSLLGAPDEAERLRLSTLPDFLVVCFDGQRGGGGIVKALRGGPAGATQLLRGLLRYCADDRLSAQQAANDAWLLSS